MGGGLESTEKRSCVSPPCCSYSPFLPLTVAAWSLSLAVRPSPESRRRLYIQGKLIEEEPYSLERFFATTLDAMEKLNFTVTRKEKQGAHARDRGDPFPYQAA